MFTALVTSHCWSCPEPGETNSILLTACLQLYDLLYIVVVLRVQTKEPPPLVFSILLLFPFS